MKLLALFSRLFGWSLDVSFEIQTKGFDGCFYPDTDCFTLYDAREMLKQAAHKYPGKEFRIEKQVKFTKIVK